MAALWLIATAAFTGAAAYVVFWDCVPGYIEGFATLKYARTPGTVVASRIIHISRHGGSGFGTWEVSVTYTYEVGGKAYTSSHAAAGGLTAWWMSEAKRVLAQFKAGERIWAYYDPDDPSHAVVSPGVQLTPYALSLFIQPFAAVSVFLLCASPLGLRGIVDPHAAAGLHIEENGDRTIIQLAPGLPMDRRRRVLSRALVLVPMAVAGIGTAATTIMDFPRADAFPVAVFALLMFVEVGILLLLRRMSANEALCLVIDRARGIVRLPVAFGRPGPVEVPISAVDSVVCVEREFQGWIKWYQARRRRMPSGPYVATNHDVDLETRGGAGHGYTVARWPGEPQKAEDVAAWLREHLGVGPKQPG